MIDIFDDIFDIDGDGETDILEDVTAWDIMLNDDDEEKTLRSGSTHIDTSLRQQEK